MEFEELDCEDDEPEGTNIHNVSNAPPLLKLASQAMLRTVVCDVPARARRIRTNTAILLVEDCKEIRIYDLPSSPKFQRIVAIAVRCSI